MKGRFLLEDTDSSLGRPQGFDEFLLRGKVGIGRFAEVPGGCVLLGVAELAAEVAEVPVKVFLFR